MQSFINISSENEVSMKNRIISFSLCVLMFMSSLIFPSGAVSVEDFCDISSGLECYGAIKWAVEKGYMQGTSESEFSPALTLTRAQFAVLMARFAGTDLTLYEGKRAFDDVPANSWYAEASVWAFENGIMKGTGNGRFTPDKVITRQEIAVLFNNYIGFTGIKVEKKIPDTRMMDRGSKRAAPWAKDAVELMHKTGIMPLDENNCFYPVEKVTRAEAASLLFSLQSAFDSINEPREKKVIAYYLLGRYANHAELKDVDVLNLHPVKAHGDGYIDEDGLSNAAFIKESGEKYNPDLKYCVCIPVNSGADIEKWMDSYADCDDFADNIVDIVARYDLDGVDFDYEFPTGSVPQKNLHYLLGSIRRKLEALGTGKDYIVSMAIAGGAWSFSLFQDLGELQHYVDYLNYMDYDLRSEAPWPTTYNHCAPYDSIYENASTYADVLLSLEAGVQREKIILGCGMYSQDWQDVHSTDTVGLYCAATPNNAAPTYYNVYRSWINYEMLDKGTAFPSNGGYYPYWDDTAKALSFYNPHTRRFMSGDEDRSVEEKCKMAVKDNLGGLMFFDYTFTAGARDWIGTEIRLFEKVKGWMNPDKNE